MPPLAGISMSSTWQWLKENHLRVVNGCEDDDMPPLTSPLGEHYANQSKGEAPDEDFEEDDMPPLDGFGRGCHSRETMPQPYEVGEGWEHDDMPPLASLSRWDPAVSRGALHY